MRDEQRRQIAELQAAQHLIGERADYEGRGITPDDLRQVERLQWQISQICRSHNLSRRRNLTSPSTRTEIKMSNDPRILRLETRLSTAFNARRKIYETMNRAGRDDLTTAEDSEFRKLTTDIEQMEARMAELRAEADRASNVTDSARALRSARGGASTGSRGGDGMYGEYSGRSFFGDTIRAGQGDWEARERLAQHAQEQRDMDRVDGTGGAFVPPSYLVDKSIELARAGRVTANLASQFPMPSGTDQINIPKITTGSSVAVQVADNTSVSETDLADTSIQLPVRTLAGQVDVALQLLEQSPVRFDQIVFADLIAEYTRQLDLQVISGSGNSGQLKGILTASNTISVAYTDTSPTTGEIYGKIAECLSGITSQRFAPPNAIVMHPRRWAWFVSARDSEGRPLVVPTAGNGSNAQGIMNGLDGLVGNLLGMAVFVDANVPTNLGSGTNEDVIIIAKTDDWWLYESSIRTRVLPEVGSGTLTTRLQVYGFVAFTAERQPKSTAKLGSTGLVTPVFG